VTRQSMTLMLPYDLRCDVNVNELMPEFPRFESQVASQNAIRRINPPRVGECSEHSMDFKRTEHSWTCYKKLRTERTVLLKDLKF